MVRYVDPLAFGALAARGWRPVGIHALVDGHAHAALARGASDGGYRPAVPGPLQVVPDSGGRPSSDRVTVRGAEPAACESGGRGRCLALVEPLKVSESQGQAYTLHCGPGPAHDPGGAGKRRTAPTETPAESAEPGDDRYRTVVTSHFGVEPGRWAAGRRSDDAARAVAAYLARCRFGHPAAETARALAYRDHSGVGRAVRRVEQGTPELQKTVQTLERRLVNP